MTATTPDISSKLYVPYGSALELMRCRAPEVLLSGSAGTGKSRAALEKIYLLSSEFPGLRTLIVRKTRASLTESALITFERDVVPEGHPILQGASRAHRRSYRFPNGSEIVLGGMDNPTRVMSTEFDCVVGDTLVESPSEIQRAYSRTFSGQLITITTAAGNKLTCTPNHPILSAHGWVSLSSLREGDYVVSRRLVQNESSGAHPNVTDEPAPIADIASALALANPGCAERVVAQPMDFHGDGADGYVHVVTAARLFQNGSLAASFYPIAQRNSMSPASIVGSVFCSKFSHAFAIGAGIDPSLTSSRTGFEESLLPLAVDVANMPEGLAFRSRAPFDATSQHFLLESADVNVNGKSNIQQSPFAGKITLDRIVKISVTDASPGRHVYNLQTANNWYFANNIVSHNCIFVQEAIELSEPEWEALSIRNRNFAEKPVLPFRQLLADTNPDRPTHWLKLRCDSGKTKLIECRHEDNPMLWRDGIWTPAGLEYLSRLDALTGPRKQRLRYGRWVQAEGVVYDGFDARLHILDRTKVDENGKRVPVIGSDWTRYWSVDFGFTAPFVWQEWAEDDDGRLYLVKEIYETQTLVEDHCEHIRRITQGESNPRLVICDHDAEGRATFEKHLGIKTVAAFKDVMPGIQAVASRLRRAEDGKPRLFLLRDAVMRRDQRLRDAGKPQCTAEEIDGYIWNEATGRNKGEEPVKENDHGCDAMRYLVAGLDCKPRKRFWAA